MIFFLLRKILSFQARLEATTFWLPVKRSITIELLVEQRICYFRLQNYPEGYMKIIVFIMWLISHMHVYGCHS